jgi:hypothetical protein
MNRLKQLVQGKEIRLKVAIDDPGQSIRFSLQSTRFGEQLHVYSASLQAH